MLRWSYYGRVPVSKSASWIAKQLLSAGRPKVKLDVWPLNKRSGRTAPSALWNCNRSCMALILRGIFFHQAGARGEKALGLVEASQTLFGLGTTSRCCSAVQGSVEYIWRERVPKIFSSLYFGVLMRHRNTYIYPYKMQILNVTLTVLCCTYFLNLSCQLNGKPTIWTAKEFQLD